MEGQKKTTSLIRFCWGHEGAWGRAAGAPQLLQPLPPRPPASSPLPHPAPLGSHSGENFALGDSSAGVWHSPPHIRGGREVQDRLAAPLVREEPPELEPILAPPGLRPQALVLALPLGGSS